MVSRISVQAFRVLHNNFVARSAANTRSAKPLVMFRPSLSDLAPVVFVPDKPSSSTGGSEPHLTVFQPPIQFPRQRTDVDGHHAADSRRADFGMNVDLIG